MTFNDKTLVVFGDSWPRGSELQEGEKTFGELVAEQLGFAGFLNYSHPASTIQHMVVQLKGFINSVKSRNDNPSAYVALFCLTAPERGMTYYEDEWLFHTVNGGFSLAKHNQISNTINQLYWKYFYSPEGADLNFNTSLISLQTLCRVNGIKDYYVAGWQKFNGWPEVSTERFYRSGQETLADFIDVKIENGFVNRDNPYIRPNYSKPNQLGHRVIADRLCEWLNDTR
jgi:hypothetical protein